MNGHYDLSTRIALRRRRGDRVVHCARSRGPRQRK